MQFSPGRQLRAAREATGGKAQESEFRVYPGYIEQQAMTSERDQDQGYDEE